MPRVQLSKLSSAGIPTCAIHKLEEYEFMCLEPNCSQRLLCPQCTYEPHATLHKKYIINFDEYLQTIAAQPLENSTDTIELLNKLLSNENTLIDNLLETQENREREILDLIDDAKYKINRLLDLVYEKEVSKIRKVHISEISKAFSNARQLKNFHSCLAQKTLPNLTIETELLDLATVLTMIFNQQSSLSISLQQGYDNLNKLLKKSQEKQMDNTGLKTLENRIKVLCDFLVDSLGIKDYCQQSNSTDSTKSGGSPIEKRSYSAHEGQIFSLAVINSDQIATAGCDKVIKLWDLKNGECFLELSGHRDVIWDLKAGFDGKYIFSGSEDKEIKVWRISEGKCKTTLKGHKASVISLCVLPARKMLVSGSREGGLLAWDLKERKVKYEFGGNNRAIRVIKPLGKDNIITGSDEGDLGVWTLKTGELLKYLRVSEGKITCLSIFANEQRVLVGDSRGELTVFELESEQQMVEVIRVTAHKKGVWAAAVSPDGTLIASGGEDKAFRIWELRSANLLKQVEENDSSIRCLEFLDASAVLYCDNNPKKYIFSK